jgi:DNA-binding CsgD family transcriptional regulator
VGARPGTAGGRSRADPISTADLRAALDLVRTVSGAHGPDQFAELATRGLHELIGCDFASYNEVNVEQGRTLVFTEPRDALRPDAEEAFARNIGEHAIALHYARHGGGPALRMSDFVSLRQFRRTTLYDELFVPVDGNYVLAVPLPVPPGIVVGFALVRRAPDFADQERALLELLRPHLAQAYERSLLRAALGALDTAASHGEQRLIVLGRDGAPLYATAAALMTLRRYFPDEDEGRLPEPVVAWLERGCPGRFTTVLGGTRLRVDPVGRRPEALLVTEAETRVAVEALAGLGLSPRESQVLALVAEGRRNAEIARQLGISPRTAKKHLENVFAKLGVHTRAAATAVALRSTA